MTLDNIFNDVYLYGPFNNSNVALTPISKMLASLDGGIHSGVPTRTTSTLTPTTLRNIEQTFFELTNEPPTTVPCQAGFVAPLPSFPFEQDHHEQDHSLGSTGSSSDSSWQTPPPAISEETVSGSNNSTPAPSKRNMGGRRPKNSSDLTPAEEEKRKVRRERNKLAAARCRKRRVDQTNELLDKVSILEREKQKLQSDIQELQIVKEELEFCLENHRDHCRLVISERKSPMEFKQPIPHIVSIGDKIKVEPIDNNSLDGPPSPKRMLLSNANPIMSAGMPPNLTGIGGNNGGDTPTLHTPTIPHRPNRPSSLAVPFSITPSQALGLHRSIADIAGVSITTPSNGVMFNFDSLMEGGTGLTPVSQPLMPNCSSMNRNPLDLATPTTEPSKLVSL